MNFGFVRVGKLKRDSFLEVMKNPVDDTDTFRDQIKTGKLNVSDLYPNDQKETFVRGEVKIGKITTKVGPFLFEAGQY